MTDQTDPDQTVPCFEKRTCTKLKCWENCSNRVRWSRCLPIFYVYCLMERTFANIVDPDQAPQQAAPDQGLPCLNNKQIKSLEIYTVKFWMLGHLE